MDIQAWWRQVREIERGLPETVFIVSQSDPMREQVGGRVVETSREDAAKLILHGSFRAATPDEIEAHQANERTERKRAQAAEQQRSGIATVTVPIGPAR